MSYQSVVPGALQDSGKRGKVFFCEAYLKLGVGVFKAMAKEPHSTESGHYQRHGGEPLGSSEEEAETKWPI